MDSKTRLCTYGSATLFMVLATSYRWAIIHNDRKKLARRNNKDNCNIEQSQNHNSRRMPSDNAHVNFEDAETDTRNNSDDGDIEIDITNKEYRRWYPKRFHHHFDFDHKYDSSDHYYDISTRTSGRRTFTRRANSEPIHSNSESLMGNKRMSYGNIKTLNSLGSHGDCLDGDSPNNSINYNIRDQSQLMPNRLIMIRHGQSMGNIDESIYAKCPDNQIHLTELGWEQAKETGKILRHQILNQTNGCKKVHFIVSPYVRTMETFHGLVSAWCDPHDFFDEEDEDKRLLKWYNELANMGVTFNEDPRIREQDFGNYQDEEKMKHLKAERYKFGIFYYRFPNGESGCDVFDR